MNKITPVDHLTFDDYYRCASERLAADEVSPWSDYTVLSVPSPYTYDPNAYADVYFMRAQEVKRAKASPVISWLFPRFDTVVMQPLSEDGVELDQKPQKIAVDNKGYIRWRSRFLTRFCNPELGHIKRYRDGLEHEMVEWFVPSPERKPELSPLL